MGIMIMTCGTNIGKLLEKYVKIEANLYKRKFENSYGIYNGPKEVKEVSIEGTVILVPSLEGKIILDKWGSDEI